MHEERLQVRVGAVVLVLVGALVIAVTAIGDRHLRPGITVHVTVERIGPLSQGTPVRSSGLELGVIQRVRLQPAPEVGPRDPTQQPATVILDLWIDRRHAGMLRENSEVFINQPQVFGEATLEVGLPRDAAPGAPLRDGATVRGVSPPGLDQMLRYYYANLKLLSELMREGAPDLEDLSAAIDELRITVRTIEPEEGAYARTEDSLARLLDEIDRVTADLDGSGATTEDLAASVARLRAFVDRARAQARTLETRFRPLGDDLAMLQSRLAPERFDRVREALARAQKLGAKMRALLDEVDAILAMLERGQGTIGGLVADKELRDEFKEVLRLMKTQPWVTVGHPQPRPPR